MPFAQAVFTAGIILCIFHSADTFIHKLRFQRGYLILALLVLLAAALFSMIEFSNELWISPGGFIAPFLIVVALWAGAKEKIWSLAALACNAIGLYLFDKFVIVPGISLYLYRYYFIGAVSGLGALLLGRYRNTVLITAILSAQLFGVFVTLEDWILGGYGMIRLGTQDELNACALSSLIAMIGIWVRVKRFERRKRPHSIPQTNMESLMEDGQTQTAPLEQKNA